ncbi:MAG: hypothetical protein IJH90_08530 [Mogibacterium sp.]|nr:hypothetical protein [Mogibacterium sp.]
MIRVACLLDKKNGTVAAMYSDAGHAVVMDAETGKILKEVPRGRASDTEFARMIGAEDVEAVITGPMNKEPFEVLAEQYFITRYDGGGLKAGEAIRCMNAYRLRMIPDYIGGTGCHSGGECHEH